MKKKIQDLLKEMNQELKKALDEAAQGGDSAADAVKRITHACRLKHEAISSFPGIEASTGVDIPFLTMFDIFDDVDHVADKANTYALMRAIGSSKIGYREIQEALQKAIDEIKNSLLGNFKFANEAAVRILKDMVESLEKMLKAIKDEHRQLKDLDQEDDGVLIKALQGERRLLLALKKDFLALFGGAVPLWDTYSLLREIDQEAESGGHLVAGYPPDSRQAKMGRSQIQAAIDAKKKLEGLVDNAVTQEAK
jgi:hypothetical protein